MSDVERILTETGERWRAAQEPPPEPDRTRWNGSRRTAPWIAAGIAVAVALAGTGLAWRFAGSRNTTPSVSVAASPPRTEADVARLILRDGDEVDAVGRIDAVPGEVPRFCAPLPEAALYRPCTNFVRAVGVDLDRLVDPEVYRGWTSWGARLRGTYRDGTLHVIAQSTPDRRDGSGDPPPCSAPPGGWRHGEPARSELDALSAEVDGRPDRYAGIELALPDREVTVVVIGVVGDPEVMRRRFARGYHGNLCVVGARFSRTELEKIASWIRPLAEAQGSGIVTFGGDATGAGVRVGMVLLTERLFEDLRGIGLDQLVVDPWLRPVRAR